jgi:acid stress-induced BolA-like protein IbaG/YrbA
MGDEKMSVKARIEEVLEQLLEAPKVDLVETARTVQGFVVSGSFEGKSQTERQDHIWEGLKAEIPEDMLVKVVSILTLTPEEADDADELDEADAS